ncbi:uncharacterized protein LOC117111468 [Anneissia japonica]|uniref:uncharacterized protein LOC117111468 n=1 Tax=Anneissia japonica TaxID=1529436 RepID=UPI0014254DBD|nr:uncharacterized protein LOC117111468 [Anneissia japonica]
MGNNSSNLARERSRAVPGTVSGGVDPYIVLARRRGIDPPRFSIPLRLADHVDNLALYDYPFENLVFAGGGNRLFAYTGALEVLHETGILKNIKRFAGTSLGALTACFAALGVGPREIVVEVEKVRRDIRKMLKDSKWGIFSLIPNTLRRYGWHPASAYCRWLELNLSDYAGKPDITFREFYEATGKELCCVATNLNRMSVEYCHLKTTPDMPVIIALRMSMSLPVLLQAVKHQTHGAEDVFVDGGLLCNYPIHVFDGWWLSMDGADNFFIRLNSFGNAFKMMETKERFGTRNDKTLGLCLYTASESSLMQSLFQDRYSGSSAKVPSTVLARSRRVSYCDVPDNTANRRTDAFAHFFSLFKEQDIDENGYLDFKTFKHFIQKNKSCSVTSDYELLFGKNMSIDEAFGLVDSSGNGKISPYDLVRFAEQRGIHVNSRLLGYARQEINDFNGYINALFNSVMNHAMKEFVKDNDYDRTIGIDTRYIRGTDFSIKVGDRDFLFEQGYRATIAYLTEYVTKQNLKKRKENLKRQTEKRKSHIVFTDEEVQSLDDELTNNT